MTISDSSVAFRLMGKTKDVTAPTGWSYYYENSSAECM